MASAASARVHSRLKPHIAHRKRTHSTHLCLSPPSKTSRAERHSRANTRRAYARRFFKRDCTHVETTWDSKLPSDEKRHALLETLHGMRILLIYDNLETLSKEEQEAMADFFVNFRKGARQLSRADGVAAKAQCGCTLENWIGMRRTASSKMNWVYSKLVHLVRRLVSAAALNGVRQASA